MEFFLWIVFLLIGVFFFSLLLKIVYAVLFHYPIILAYKSVYRYLRWIDFRERYELGTREKMLRFIQRIFRITQVIVVIVNLLLLTGLSFLVFTYYGIMPELCWLVFVGLAFLVAYRIEFYRFRKNKATKNAVSQSGSDNTMILDSADTVIDSGIMDSLNFDWFANLDFLDISFDIDLF